jgi:hypothetical protein
MLRIFFLSLMTMLQVVDFGPAPKPFLPGEHDKEAAQSVRAMAQALPLSTTTLQKIAPEFAVEKVPGLSWEEALAAAEKQFGHRQPARAAFLRKYLTKGSPMAQLVELQLSDTGGPRFDGLRHYWFSSPINSKAYIEVRLVDGKLAAEPELELGDRKLDGVFYPFLRFDAADHLIAAGHHILLTDEKGKGWIDESTTPAIAGAPYSVTLNYFDGTGSETIYYTPEFVIRHRDVINPEQPSYYRDDFEKGVLRKRVHYGVRDLPNGRKEYYPEREENFP